MSDVDRPTNSLTESLGAHLTRRSLLKRMALVGATAPVIAGLLAACGDDDADDDSPGTEEDDSDETGATDDEPTEEEEEDVEDEEQEDEEDDEEEDSASDDEAEPGSDTFVVVDGTEPDSLAPADGTGPFQHPINGMFEGLVEFDEDVEIQPLLSTEWEVSEDGSEWTFQLREGVMFHDGSEFTSADVQATVDFILNPDLNISRRANYELIQEVDTSEDYVVRFITEPANPDFVFLMGDGSAKIISSAAVEEHGPVEFGQNHPSGTGPYQFVEWVPNDRVQLRRFEDYWGEPPGLENFIFRPISEVATRIVVMRTGEADIAFNLPPADVGELEDVEGVEVNSSPSLTVHMMEPKVTQPPLDDARVRRALNMAIDKDAIIENIMQGYAQPLLTPAIPGLFGTIELDPIPYDPEQAQALMEEAGYPDGFEVDMVYTSGRWAGDDQVVEAVQGFWANNLNVQMQIDRRDHAGFVDALRDDPDEFPGLIIMPIRTSLFNDYHLYRMYHSEATTGDTAQRSGYSNPEVDRLLEQQRQVFDDDEREELFHEIQRLIWEDQPFIYLFQGANIWAEREDLEGFWLHPANDFVPKQVRRT